MTSLIGKYVFHGKFNTATFNISKQRNPEKYEKLLKLSKSMRAELPDAYVPIYEKVYNGNSYIQISGLIPRKIRTSSKLNISELYEMRFTLKQTPTKYILQYTHLKEIDDPLNNTEECKTILLDF